MGSCRRFLFSASNIAFHAYPALRVLRREAHARLRSRSPLCGLVAGYTHRVHVPYLSYQGGLHGLRPPGSLRFARDSPSGGEGRLVGRHAYCLAHGMQRRPDTSEHPHAQAHPYPSAHAASDDACGNTYADDYTYTHSDSGAHADDYTYTHSDSGAHSDTYPDTHTYNSAYSHSDSDSYPCAYSNVQLWQRSRL